MNRTAIIQARLSSSRLPGKVLLEADGEPMLARVVARVRQARLVDNIVVATTSDPTDEPILHYCHEHGIACFRGDPYDVLDRFYQAALEYKADVIVRITADCPMIAPEEIERVIQTFLESGVDFAANRLPPPFKRTTPIGMDTEVCSFEALQQAWQQAERPYQREHVMPYLYDTPGRFKVQVVDMQPSLGHLRFTVDTPEDLQQANQIYAAFGGRDDFSLKELLAENERHPEWQAGVSKVQHKNLYEVDQRAALEKPMRRSGSVPSCPLCGSAKVRDFEKVESFGFPLQYLICENCGFVFQDPKSSQAADPDFYQQTYRQIYQESAEPTNKDLYQQTQRALNQAGWLRSLGYNQFERVLDIGASSGLLLQTFSQQFEAEVTGVEPGDAYRSLAESKGILMTDSIEKLVSSRFARFDLVTLMHVLEHLEQPVQVLRQIREDLLAEEGLLLVEVPNFYAHDSYELAHLSCFTEHTLRELLRLAGFEPIATRKHGMPRSEILPLYLTVLAKPDSTSQQKSPKLEKAVRLKRSLGMLRRKLLTRLNPSRAWLPLEGKQ
ncbi:MAG: methyltransferase domain-containing protein [Anaerolineaceae bacterium]|nr:methyltransferase domain-containing protein [Anaerolineaceae bacterium]